MMQVYNDAKKPTLSVHSFPNRVVIADIAHALHMCDEKLITVGPNDLQYLTHKSHRELLECKVSSYRQHVAQELLYDTLALSVRKDRSVDRTQIDKIFVMAKIIINTDDEKQYFLDAAELEERGVKGLCYAVSEVCSFVVGESHATEVSAHVFTCYRWRQCQHW
jgi:hypothetical protein